jgi:hypothetical protein
MAPVWKLLEMLRHELIIDMWILAHLFRVGFAEMVASHVNHWVTCDNSSECSSITQGQLQSEVSTYQHSIVIAMFLISIKKDYSPALSPASRTLPRSARLFPFVIVPIASLKHF